MASELDAKLSALAAPLEQELKELDARLFELERQTRLVRADKSRLEQIVRRLNGAPPKTGPKPKKPRPGLVRPSPESIEKVRAVLRVYPGALNFTAPQLHEALAGIVSHDTVHRAVLAMHEDGEVQLIGKGGVRGQARTYRYLGARENG